MKRWIFSVLAAGLASTAQAEVQLYDKNQLVSALGANSPCCVVDGRDEGRRQRQALAEAVLYRPGLKVAAGDAPVVVVGDNDKQASQVGEALAKDQPSKRILVVKGGLPAWQATLVALKDAPPGGYAIQFVIPKNTCEQGTPLQKLLSRPK
jgi:hypothetical protein